MTNRLSLYEQHEHDTLYEGFFGGHGIVESYTAGLIGLSFFFFFLIHAGVNIDRRLMSVSVRRGDGYVHEYYRSLVLHFLHFPFQPRISVPNERAVYDAVYLSSVYHLYLVD